MRKVVLHRVIVVKLLPKFYLILLIHFFLQVFCLMLIGKVIICMAKIHQNEEDHDSSHNESVHRNEELLVLRN